MNLSKLDASSSSDHVQVNPRYLNAGWRRKLRIASTKTQDPHTRTIACGIHSSTHGWLGKSEPLTSTILHDADTLLDIHVIYAAPTRSFRFYYAAYSLHLFGNTQLRQGTQTLIQALQAIPWEDSDDEGDGNTPGLLLTDHEEEDEEEDDARTFTSSISYFYFYFRTGGLCFLGMLVPTAVLPDCLSVQKGA